MIGRGRVEKRLWLRAGDGDAATRTVGGSLSLYFSCREEMDGGSCWSFTAIDKTRHSCFMVADLVIVTVCALTCSLTSE